MKKVTNRDHSHPHYRLKDHLQGIRKVLQSLPNKNLSRLIYQILEHARKDGLLPPVAPDNALQHRHQMVGFAVAREELFYKAKWKETYGWDFDDCYDPEKYAVHLKAAYARRQSPSSDCPQQEAAEKTAVGAEVGP